MLLVLLAPSPVSAPLPLLWVFTAAAIAAEMAAPSDDHDGKWPKSIFLESCLDVAAMVGVDGDAQGTLNPMHLYTGRKVFEERRREL